MPHAKLIAILRNPVERAYSDFLMYRRDGKEKLGDFARALDEQSDRAARQDPTGFYVSTGFYGRQLARYYDLFPADQIRVYLLEELTADSTRVLCRMFEFLGVDAAFVPGDERLQHLLATSPEGRQSASLISLHEAAVADHVCGQYGG